MSQIGGREIQRANGNITRCEVFSAGSGQSVSLYREGKFTATESRWDSGEFEGASRSDEYFLSKPFRIFTTIAIGSLNAREGTSPEEIGSSCRNRSIRRDDQ